MIPIRTVLFCWTALPMQFNLEGLEYEAPTKMNFKELPREHESCISQINF